jgi:hypothetical protein
MDALSRVSDPSDADPVTEVADVGIPLGVEGFSVSVDVHVFVA